MTNLGRLASSVRMVLRGSGGDRERIGASMTLSLVTLLTCMFVLSGCSGTTCSTQGCGTTLEIEFEESNTEPWSDGVWSVSVRTSGEELGTCELELPVGSAPPNPNCSGDLYLHAAQDGESLERVVSSFRSARADALPEEITVRLERDGQLVSEQDIEPDYQTYRPNGPECAPECRSATIPYSF